MRRVDPPEPGSLILKENPYGKGVFAGRKFSRGEVIIEFTGDWFTYEEQYEPCLVEDMYLQVGENLFIGPSGGLDDFINHSCDPNAAIIIGRQAGRQAGRTILLVAIRDISADEEIAYDYSLLMIDDDWEMACQCGSPNCRKRVREFKYLPDEVQEHYVALGIVPDYVMKRLGRRT